MVAGRLVATHLTGHEVLAGGGGGGGRGRAVRRLVALFCTREEKERVSFVLAAEETTQWSLIHKQTNI